MAAYACAPSPDLRRESSGLLSTLRQSMKNGDLRILKGSLARRLNAYRRSTVEGYNDEDVELFMCLVEAGADINMVSGNANGPYSRNPLQSVAISLLLEYQQARSEVRESIFACRNDDVGPETGPRAKAPQRQTHLLDFAFAPEQTKFNRSVDVTPGDSATQRPSQMHLIVPNAINMATDPLGSPSLAGKRPSDNALPSLSSPASTDEKGFLTFLKGLNNDTGLLSSEDTMNAIDGTRKTDPTTQGMESDTNAAAPSSPVAMDTKSFKQLDDIGVERWLRSIQKSLKLKVAYISQTHILDSA